MGSPNPKRRDSGSLVWNKLFGGRHQSGAGGCAVGEVGRVAVGTLESQPWSLFIPRALGPCCQGA